MNSEKELWKTVLAEIELEVSKPIFVTFFKGTSLLSFENSVATIGTATLMTASYIEKRYYALIKKVLDQKTNQNTSLIFTSKKREEKSPQEHQAPGPLFAHKPPTRAPKNRPTRVRGDYTFENYAVSESNQLAYTAARAVATSPGNKYNPLYLYGTVGTGKTHLMHAAANMVWETKHDAVVLYMTTEEFTNEVVEAIRDKTTTQLRKKFRTTDLLLLDDIQFLSGKERVQEELFHTFNSLIDKNKQIVFTSDRPPSEIKKIEARLASRFEGGLTVDVQPPDFELRTAILLIKSKKYALNLTVEAAKIIAQRILDARALEGFLLKLSSVVATRNVSEVKEELVHELLGARPEKSTIIRPDDLINTIWTHSHRDAGCKP